MEIIKELPTVDYILVPIGGGGLCTGVSTLAKLLNPNIKVIGVEPAGANCMQESLRQGKVVTLPEGQHHRGRHGGQDAGQICCSPISRRMWMTSSPSRTSELIVAFLDHGGESQDDRGEFRPSDRGGLKASERDRKRRWYPS